MGPDDGEKWIEAQKEQNDWLNSSDSHKGQQLFKAIADKMLEQFATIQQKALTTRRRQLATVAEVLLYFVSKKKGALMNAARQGLDAQGQGLGPGSELATGTQDDDDDDDGDDDDVDENKPIDSGSGSGSGSGSDIDVDSGEESTIQESTTQHGDNDNDNNLNNGNQQNRKQRQRRRRLQSETTSSSSSSPLPPPSSLLSGSPLLEDHTHIRRLLVAGLSSETGN